MSEPVSRSNTGSAMQQAVAAEQAARSAIADAEARAATAVENARAKARAILNAVPGRIARLRERGARTVQRALAVIAGEEIAAALKLRETTYAPEVLDRTVHELVKRLTGDDRGAPPKREP